MTVNNMPAVRASALARGRTASTLRSIASGDTLITDVLVPTTESATVALGTIARARVERVLRAVPGVGEYTATQVCHAARIDRFLRLEALSPARRQQLADAIGRLDLSTYTGTGVRRRVGS